MINVYFTELPKTLTEILGLKYDETMSYEDRVQKRYDYIQEQLEKNPGYEGWDYIEHISFGSVFNHLITFEYMISTKGRILTLFMQEGKYKLLNGKYNDGGYKEQTLRVNKKSYYLLIHRTVATTFIPKNKKDSINQLFVNHKDLKKINNHFLNLEWCTSKENTHHARFNGAFNQNVYFDKCFKGTWVVQDKYNGFEFIINNISELINLGLNSGVLNKVLLGTRTTALGCTWEINTNQSLPTIPEFILEKITNDPIYAHLQVIPLQGTIIKEGSHKGEKFVIYGGKELKSWGFCSRHVFNAIGNKKLAHSCNWRYISRDEAETLQRGLTLEQVKYLGLKFKLKG